MQPVGASSCRTELESNSTISTLDASHEFDVSVVEKALKNEHMEQEKEDSNIFDLCRSVFLLSLIHI